MPKTAFERRRDYRRLGRFDRRQSIEFEAAGNERIFLLDLRRNFARRSLRIERARQKQTPQKIFKPHTENYWRAWVNKNDLDFADLSPEIVELFKRSLLVVRTQIDNDGAILAANDSDVTERATDHYSYLWTRDGALVATRSTLPVIRF
jgi:GH15 family glucan-1,4-alpha-glucosidase